MKKKHQLRLIELEESVLLSQVNVVKVKNKSMTFFDLILILFFFLLFLSFILLENGNDHFDS
jgi:hypothetical protein